MFEKEDCGPTAVELAQKIINEIHEHIKTHEAVNAPKKYSVWYLNSITVPATNSNRQFRKVQIKTNPACPELFSSNAPHANAADMKNGNRNPLPVFVYK
eukprot:g6278.t1